MSQIKIVASANMAQAQAQFAALTATIAAMNAEMAATAIIPQGNPAGFAKQARAASAVSTAYSHALASSGAFRVEQLKINDAVTQNTKLLEKQKLGFSKVFGKNSRDNMRAVYREQLAMQQSVTRMQGDLVSDGRQSIQMGIPTQVHDSWDTLNNKVGFFGTKLASASSEMVNWGKNTQWAGRQLMAGISFPIAAFGAAAGVMAYQVDKELTRIAKVYDTTADQNSTSLKEQGAAEAELSALRIAGMETAVETARQYGSAVTETLSTQADLASSGLNGIRLQESTNEVMRIATLGEIDHAQATQALISLQAILGHTAKETADDFNYLNAIENATSLTTDDFTAAIPRALGPMKEMGGTLQDLGVLMVAMKERGVAAAEGANAIKSMMQRLYRPSEAVRNQWVQLSGMDPMNFITESGGDVMKILPMIADAVRDVDKAGRVQMLSGLFGTYQVARMSAMLKGLDDMEAGVGQTAKAMEVGMQTAEQNATIAQQELAAQAESASGRFKRAWESLRGELAIIGEPFLEIASRFLQISSAVLGFFNGMPGWIKTGVVFGAMLAAVIGPVVMLIGLFANFGGNIGKFVAWILKLTTSFNLFNKGQWAAQASAKLAETGFIKQATAAEILESQLKGLTLAAEQSALAMSELAQVPLSPELQAKIDGIEPTRNSMLNAKDSKYALGPVEPTPAQWTSLYTDQITDSRGVPRDPENRMRTISKENAALIVQGKVTDRIAENQASIKDKGLATERISRATAGHMNGMAVTGAAMAASMVLMSGAAGDTGAEIGKWVMLMAIVVPAMKGLGPIVTTMGSKFAVAAKAAAATRVQALGAAGATASAAGWSGIMAGGIKGMAKGFSAMLGPIGWVTLGVGAVAGILMTINKHQNAVEEAQRRQMQNQADLVGQTEEWAAVQEDAVNTWRDFQSMQATAAEKDKFDTQVDFYKSDEQKDATGAFGDMDSVDQDVILMSKYANAIKSVGMTSTEAKAELAAFLYATGEGFDDATMWANRIGSELGSLGSGTDWLSMFNDVSASAMRAATEGSLDEAEDLGLQAGKLFREGILDPSGSSEDRRAYWESLKASVLDPWQDIADELQNQMKDMTAEELALNNTRFGLTPDMSGDEMRAAYVGLDDDAKAEFGDFYRIGTDGTRFLNTELRESVKAVDEFEQKTVGATSESLGLAASVNRLGELADSVKMKVLLEDMGEADAATEALRKKMILLRQGDVSDNSVIPIVSAILPRKTDAELEGYANTISEAQQDTALMEQNARNFIAGIAPGDDIMEAISNYTDGVKIDMDTAADNALRFGNNLKGSKVTFDFDDEDMKSMLKAGMAGVQQDIADMLTEDLDSRLEAQMEKKVTYWENAVERMQDRQEKAQDEMQRSQEREQNQFENRWERRTSQVEKAYDARIDKVNETIEAEQEAEEIRQKIFDAEQSRLDRLTDTANSTIDFNMALQTGDLDEAAKIRNDMEAAAVGWALSDAAEESSTKSERRQERLETRAEGIEDNKDKALKALEKREEAERKSMERRQEQEQKHLDKIQEMNMESLQDQAEAAKETFAEESEMKKESLDEQMDALKAVVPRTEKELKALLKSLGIDYKNFGLDVLKPESKEWGEFFKNSFTTNVRNAGREIGNDNMWANTGAKVAKDILLGMGFGGMNKFKKFVQTGELPDDFGKRPPKADTRDYGSEGRAYGQPGTFHAGGSVDGGAGSGRKGVARTLKGLHPNEVMARLQKKEFVVNKDSAAKYGPELEAMNKGIYDPTRGVMGGGGTNIAGIMTGALAGMLSAGIAMSMRNAFDSKYSQVLAQQSGFSLGSIKAGEYGDSSFTAEQLSNAKTISSVGLSLGATSRDIIIALMTAMQESGLRNLDYGDLDSVGLFQQRDTWGSTAARTNPEEATRMFFLGGNAGQRGLFDFEDRASMSLAEAAQSVQVSAYPDAYAKWEDEAKSIFSALRTSGTSNSSYVPGPGGSSRPVKGPFRYGDIHGTSTGFPAIDFATPTGIPIYAVGDGVISRSEDIRGPLPTDTYRGDGPYGSYGRVIQLRLDSGAEVLYAHLSERGVAAGTRVAGGSMIGRTGNTGNSSNDHLHFGATNGPLTWLKTGGQTINDGIAMLHRGETVLTKPLTDDLNATVRAFGKSSKEILSGRRGGNREGQLEKAKTFARNQVGKPYAWGQEGPNGYDCSGLQSAIINVIKGNHPYNRLFATGNMAEVIPNLGFKRGNGGKSDYSVGWFTGDPGHTSGRIGDMGIESTGNAVRSQGATPVGAFPNQWHLPLTSVAAQTSTNPVGINKNSKESRKAPVTPWTKEDGINSPAEGWGKETMVAEVAMSPFWTYANSAAAAPAANAVSNTIAANLDAGTGNKAGLQIGTLNTWVGASADATITDVGRLIPGADFLGLTEMGTKFAAVKKFLAKQNWGAVGGGSRDQSMNMMAYNKNTQELVRSGQRKLGDKMADVVGGREKRYANYGLFTDKESGRNTWQVAAHTVPAGRGLNPKNAPLYYEQWKNLNGLVDELSGSAPVFVSGDLNVHKGASNFQTPGNLDEFASQGVDYVFGNKKLAELQRQWTVSGMHTDHGGKALMSNFSLPSHKNGAENIMWDNTLVNMHKNESILTADQSNKFRRLADNIDNVAGGGSNEYNVNVYVTDAAADADQIANKVITKLKTMESRRPTRRRS